MYCPPAERERASAERGRDAGAPAPRITNVTGYLEEACVAGMSGARAYALQDLFTVYVHRSPGAPGAPPGSMFHGRDIPKRCAPGVRAAHVVHSCAEGGGTPGAASCVALVLRHYALLRSCAPVLL